MIESLTQIAAFLKNGCIRAVQLPIQPCRIVGVGRRKASRAGPTVEVLQHAGPQMCRCGRCKLADLRGEPAFGSLRRFETEHQAGTGRGVDSTEF